MKSISSSSRSYTRDALKLVNVRRLVLLWLAISLTCALSAFVGGFWLGQSAQEPQDAVMLSAAESDEQHFALNRAGELIGRLRSLEADAALLRKMLDEQRMLSQQVSALDPSLLPELAPDAGVAGRGGVFLPARECAAAELELKAHEIEVLEESLDAARCLRRQLDQLLERVTAGNAQLMAIPSHQPVQGARLGSAFGNRRDPFNKRLAFHSGVDFSIASGADVVAAAGGRVTFARRNGGYGKQVEIDHGNGLLTRYAHLQSISVKKADVLTPGQLVGRVGSTGRSTGPHLHFEVLHRGRFVDPQRFLALAALPRDDSGLAHD